jgi:hypothetical protein
MKSFETGFANYFETKAALAGKAPYEGKPDQVSLQKETVPATQPNVPGHGKSTSEQSRSFVSDGQPSHPDGIFDGMHET